MRPSEVCPGCALRLCGWLRTALFGQLLAQPAAPSKKFDSIAGEVDPALEQRFLLYADKAKELTGLSRTQMLTIYAYYKQASIGDAPSSSPASLLDPAGGLDPTRGCDECTPAQVSSGRDGVAP